jgi:hypothetical protein
MTIAHLIFIYILLRFYYFSLLHEEDQGSKSSLQQFFFFIMQHKLKIKKKGCFIIKVNEISN